MSLKCSIMVNKNVNNKFIIFIICISKQILKFSVLNNITANIVSVNFKGSIIFKFLWVIYCIKPLIVLSVSIIKDNGVPVCI